MSTPIQQAIEALWVLAEHNALHFGEMHNTVTQSRDAISALQSLQGVELPPLPAPTWSSKVTGWPYHKDDMRTYARTAVAAAMARGAAPSGWKWVPVEPTPEMLAAILEPIKWAGGKEAYRNMLSAAPTPEKRHELQTNDE